MARTKDTDTYDRWAKRLHLIRHLGGKCVECGYDEHPSALDFHHQRDKKFGIAESLMKSLAALEEEANKCKLLCANCHRIHHSTYCPEKLAHRIKTKRSYTRRP